MINPKSILITGASSGIGRTLALAYAGPDVFVAFSGRNQQRVDEVAEELRALGAMVDARVLDVSDKQAMADWIDEVDEQRPLELVVANAGVGISKDDGLSFAEITEQTFGVNVYGICHTVHPALEKMLPRQRGQIAIVSSIAGFVGMPSYVAYSSSKNTVRAYGEGLRGLYKSRGIEVNVICPGFVTTRMTEKNKYPMPFLMDAERAARIMKRGLERNKARIGFPWPTYLFARSLQIMPLAWCERITGAMPRK